MDERNPFFGKTIKNSRRLLVSCAAAVLVGTGLGFLYDFLPRADESGGLELSLSPLVSIPGPNRESRPSSRGVPSASRGPQPSASPEWILTQGKGSELFAFLYSGIGQDFMESQRGHSALKSRFASPYPVVDASAEGRTPSEDTIHPLTQEVQARLGMLRVLWNLASIPDGASPEHLRFLRQLSLAILRNPNESWVVKREILHRGSVILQGLSDFERDRLKSALSPSLIIASMRTDVESVAKEHHD